MITAVADIIIPMVIFLIILYGLLSGQEMYQSFLEGVRQGFRTVFEIAPTMIALFMAVEIFRGSGALNGVITLLKPLAVFFGISGRVLSVIFVKLFSSSAATGLLLDIYKTLGPDSFDGFLASIILCSTETCFYTISVYFAAVGITKTRYTLAGALFATGMGVISSFFVAKFFMT